MAALVKAKLKIDGPSGLSDLIFVLRALFGALGPKGAAMLCDKHFAGSRAAPERHAS